MSSAKLTVVREREASISKQWWERDLSDEVKAELNWC